jgi:beta-galactosidase GanA
MQLMVEGEAFLMLSGELCNSSAACAEDMPGMFDRLAGLHLNTVIAPVSWELVEPEEGAWDFALVEALLVNARRCGMRLVLLWFGSWKNGKSSYAPGWVRADTERFPRVQLAPGRNCDVLSPFAPSVTAADARAFAALLGYLREADAAGTVVMVQVENEVGILGPPRDYSPLAEAAFRENVPSALTDHLAARGAELLPEVREPWVACGALVGRPWAETFGECADEFFMAWHMASHLEAVAAAGRAEHDLPMYANAWLVQAGQTRPGRYPSGGPVSRVLDIWQAAAPHLDLLAPDLYALEFKEVCASYTRAGNPLFIPETYRDDNAAAAVFYALGEHAALGFAPFAVDNRREGDPLGESYAALAEVMSLLTAAQAEGRVRGFYQEGEADETQVTLAGLRIYARTTFPRERVPRPGGALLISLGGDEFLAVGYNYEFRFGTLDSTKPNLEMLQVDEGCVRGGEWVHHRRLNGDESAHGQMLPLIPCFWDPGASAVYFAKGKVNRGIGAVDF